MSLQLPLLGPRRRGDQIRAELLALVRKVVERHGTKVVAAELDRGASELSNQLAERDRHKLSIADLCEVMAIDDLDTIVSGLAELRGLDVQRRPALTDAQWRERVTRAIAKHGKVGAAILEDAQVEP